MVEIPIGNIFNLYKPTKVMYARCHKKYWSRFTISKHYQFGYVVDQNNSFTDFDNPFDRNYILGCFGNIITNNNMKYNTFRKIFGIPYVYE